VSSGEGRGLLRGMFGSGKSSSGSAQEQEQEQDGDQSPGGNESSAGQDFVILTPVGGEE
jgi:hypothetical protein